MSNIPIVQGVAVPSGDGNKASTSTPYYQSSGNEEYAAADLGTFEKPEKQPNQFRDVPWAILFILHLAGIIGVITMNMISGNVNGGEFDLGTYSGLIWLVGVSAVVSTILGSFTLGFMMKFATALVKMSLICTVVISGLVGVLGIMSGQLFMGILGIFMFAIGICYAKAVWPRIPFAASNLKTSCAGVKSNMGLMLIAYATLIVAFVWSALWIIGLGDALSTSNGGILFFLFLSYYWVHQVLTNTLTVTTAGTVGTWWHVPEEANSCCSSAIQDSFCRATTYSFGSICLGSLLVAIIQALRSLAESSRNNDDGGQILACIIDCILACIQGIIEYLNKWAYIYVGLYGFGYFEAGKNVIQLFQHKGWTVIISDDLCDRVLFMVSLGVGLISGLVSLALAAANPSLLESLQIEDGAASAGAGFVIGFFVGVLITSILMSVVGAGVNTVIVCYAESPAEFEANHPQLSSEMRAAWHQAWPEIIS